LREKNWLPILQWRYWRCIGFCPRIGMRRCRFPRKNKNSSNVKRTLEDDEIGEKTYCRDSNKANEHVNNLIVLPIEMLSPWFTAFVLIASPHYLT